MKTLQAQQEQITSQKFSNPILNGNLNILTVLLGVNPQVQLKFGSKIYALLQNLIQKTLSNENRLLQYQLMAKLNPLKLLQYLQTLIKDIKPTDKYQIKQNFVGIKNLGSTCYMNSILQQFFTIKDFRNLILKHSLKQIPSKTQVNGTQIVDDFMYQLQKMYTYLNLSNRKFYFPKQFCLTIKDYNKKPINTSIQQDAHQFLNNLFDKVQKYLKQAGNLPDLQKVFQGKTICQITCKQCQTKKQKIQDFYHLAVEVKGSASLNESFKKFIAPQAIQGYFCQKCQKKSQKITKQTFINTAPEVLIINLQRIIFDLNTFQKVKVHSKLQFPQNLDLQQFIHLQSKNDNKNYKLKGVVIHSGTSEGGHYYSLIKIDNQWYKFNDQTVTKFSFSDLEREAFGGGHNNDGWGENQFSTNAYILFYQVDKQQQDQIQKNQVIQTQYNERLRNSQIVNENQTLQYQKDQRILSTQKQSTIDISPQKSMKSIQQNQCTSIFQWQVQQQNKQFFKQLQIHQQTFFDFVNKMYQQVRPHEVFETKVQMNFYQQWQTLPNVQIIQKIFNIYKQVMKFIVTFSNIPHKTIQIIGTAIYQILTLLPESVYSLIHKEIDYKKWAQIMCTHNQIGVRQMYKVVLNKILFGYINYYGWSYNLKNQKKLIKIQSQQLQQKALINQKYQLKQSPSQQNDKVLQILDYFLKTASSQLVAKNVFKSYYFFQFWNISIFMDVSISNFCLKNNMLLILLDLLMGNEGPLATKQIKRQDFPYEVAVPLVQAINRLIYRKRNLMGLAPFKNEFFKQEDYVDLTDIQTQVLSSNQFYKKMMKFKYDNGNLAQVIYFMSFNDYKFSQKICQLFLIALNKLDQVQDSFALLNNIKAYLLIKDQYQNQRIKWLLGIPQFQTITRLAYGLRYSNQSTNIIYVSSRYFINDQKYKPALQVLHQKKNYFTDFQVRGIITLLQILISSDQALNYLLSIPPPCYLYYNYLSWIEQYIRKLQTQDHYGLSYNQKVLAQNMRSIYQQVAQKVTKVQLPDYPILKKIIGTNKMIDVDQQIENQQFAIKKWSHQTYVLDNLPQQTTKQNLSLPDQIFSIKQAKSYAKFFIENNDIKFCDVQIPSQKTVNTIIVNTKKPLKLKFNLPHFNHQIFIRKGEMLINYPYSPLTLQGYLQVEFLEQEINKQVIVQNKISQPNYPKMQIQPDDGDVRYCMNPKGDIAGYTNSDPKSYMTGNNTDTGFDIPCQVCTYLNNITRDRCEMCDNYLK